MSTKNLFILDLKTFLIDLIIVIIGFILTALFFKLCIFGPCKQHVLSYVGMILVLISIIHFLVNLIIFIIKKLSKPGKKIKVKRKK